MKNRKEKKSGMVKMIMVAIVLIVVLSSIPASAFELVLATGDSPTQPTVAKVYLPPPPQHLVVTKSLKDLIELPQV